MATELAISAEARLNEALARETYLQQRCEALYQNLLNRDRAANELKIQKDELEVSLKAQIASLEDQLRVARRDAEQEGQSHGE